MHLGAVGAVADVAVDPANLRHSIDPPAGVADRLAGEIDRIVSDLLAVLKRPLRPPEGAAAKVRLETLPGEAVLHRHQHRAAERIEAVCRVGGDDRRSVDRVGGDQVPVDRVAKRLVDSDAILIDRQTDRASADWGGVEAAIAEVGLKVVAGDVADRDAGRLTLHGLGQGGVMPGLDVARVDGMGGAREFREIDRSARRSRRDDVESRENDGVGAGAAVAAAKRAAARQPLRAPTKASSGFPPFHAPRAATMSWACFPGGERRAKSPRPARDLGRIDAFPAAADFISSKTSRRQLPNPTGILPGRAAPGQIPVSGSAMASNSRCWRRSLRAWRSWRRSRFRRMLKLRLAGPGAAIHDSMRRRRIVMALPFVFPSSASARSPGTKPAAG